MKSIRNVKTALKEVYKNKGYLFFTIGFSIVIFLFNALINNYKLLLSSFSFKLLFSLIGGIMTTITPTSLIFLVIISILAGIVISMGIFLIRRQIKGSVGTSAASVVIGIAMPACPSCAIGLLSILGLGGFLAVLPFKGLELGVLGVILLVFSTVYLSGKIVADTCTISTKGGKKWNKIFR